MEADIKLISYVGFRYTQNTILNYLYCLVCTDGLSV